MFTGAVILIVYWLSTLIALRGVQAFAKVGSYGFIAGTAVPSAYLIMYMVTFLAAMRLRKTKPAADEIVIATYCPDKLPAAQALTKGLQTGATLP
jgi:hypothetical protein